MWSLQPRRGGSLPPPTEHTVADRGVASPPDSYLSTAASSAIEAAWLPHVVAQCAKKQLEW